MAERAPHRGLPPRLQGDLYGEHVRLGLWERLRDERASRARTISCRRSLPTLRPRAAVRPDACSFSPSSGVFSVYGSRSPLRSLPRLRVGLPPPVGEGTDLRGCPRCGYVGWYTIEQTFTGASEPPHPTRISRRARPRHRADAAEIVVGSLTGGRRSSALERRDRPFLEPRLHVDDLPVEWSRGRSTASCEALLVQDPRQHLREGGAKARPAGRPGSDEEPIAVEVIVGDIMLAIRPRARAGRRAGRTRPACC